MTNRKNLYGYRIENGVLAVCPDEEPVVERVATLYLAGASYQAIADTLNKEGIPFSQEAPLWNKYKVKRLLENPRYTGSDGYPPILDEATFRAVQEQICSKTAGYTVKEKRPVLQFKDCLRCPCGGALQRHGGTNQRRDTLYLKCTICGTLTTILDNELLAEVSRQTADHDRPDEKPYAPSGEVVRLTNAINRGLEHPDAPENVVVLIMQGISARYDCCPAPTEYEIDYRLSEADLKRLGQAVSHITIAGNQDVTVHFK